MRTRLTALCLAILGMPLSVALAHPPAEPVEDVQIAQAEVKEPCPTEIEVQPYIWIEPTTGVEYRVLHLHCPGEDEM